LAGGQRCLGDVDTQATACAGDEPNLLVRHGLRLVSFAMALTLGRLTEKKNA
jgi:hypothetical protein